MLDVKKLYCMFDNELEHHPDARLTDLYKLFMQSAFGPGHIIKDYNTAKSYLQDELNNYQQYISKFPPETQSDYFTNLKNEYKYGNFNFIACPCLILDCDAFIPLARYSLQLIIDNIIPFQDFFDAFIMSTRSE